MNRPAGFWIRFLALIIDVILFGVARMALDFVLNMAGVIREPSEAEKQLLQKIAQEGGGPAELFGASLRIMHETGTYVSTGIFFVLSTIAIILFISFKGGTPGKLALGLRIRMVGTDKSPTLWRTFLREIIGKYFLWTMTLGIGAYMVAFNKKKRGLHDYAAGTEVVKLAEE